MALGDKLGSIEVEKGRVLYLAGENPDDVKSRWIAMCELGGVDPTDVDVDFIEGGFNISEQMDVLAARATAVGGYSLVVVDTSPAYTRARTRTPTPSWATTPATSCAR